MENIWRSFHGAGSFCSLIFPHTVLRFYHIFLLKCVLLSVCFASVSHYPSLSLPVTKNFPHNSHCCVAMATLVESHLEAFHVASSPEGQACSAGMCCLTGPFWSVSPSRRAHVGVFLLISCPLLDGVCLLSPYIYVWGETSLLTSLSDHKGPSAEGSAIHGPSDSYRRLPRMLQEPKQEEKKQWATGSRRLFNAFIHWLKEEKHSFNINSNQHSAGWPLKCTPSVSSEV